MTLFIILGLMTVVTVVLMVLPLVRVHGAVARRADYDIEIYRDQLDELERDVERGVIDADERTSARIEIQRRMLAAAPHGQGANEQENRAAGAGKGGMIAGFAIIILVPLAAGSLYLGLGSPTVVDQPFADRPAAMSPMDGNPEVEAVVARLAERLENEPDDLDGWLMLGRSYSVLGLYMKAVAAMERAWKLDGKDPDIIATLAEYRIFATGGMVNPAAMADLETLQRIEPGHPTARFYLGLARAQAGKYQDALDQWIAFARESPADAPWMDTLKTHITDVSDTLGVPVPDGLEGLPVAMTSLAAPGPNAEDLAAAKSLSSDEQIALIRSMVARLAERLEDEPEDIEGWRRLAKAYSVLGETDQAVDAYVRAAAQTPDDIALLGEFADAIIETAPEDAPLSAAAVEIFNQLLALDENSPVALWHLGLAAAEAGNRDRAYGFWERLLALIPADSNDRSAVQRAIDSL